MTVVVPCYDYGRYLSDAVHSALQQEDVDVDVIIVDDASPDDSLAVAHRLAGKDPRVRVLANEVNRGAVATFNRGLAAATGEFLVRLDADDLLTPGSLQRAVAVMQRFPRVGLVYGHPVHFSGAARPPARQRPDSWTVWAGRDWLAARCVDGTNAITSPEVVMRRSVVDITGGQRPLKHTHDMEMWLRISAHSDVAYIRGADQAWHREHPGSLSTKAEEPIVILGEIRDAFTILFNEIGPTFPAADALRGAAHRAVAQEALDQATRIIDRGEASPEVQSLLGFAAACAPEIRSTRQWTRSARRAEAADRPRASVDAAMGSVARLRRRLRAMRRYARWARTGAYEPMCLTRGRIDEGARWAP